MRITAIAGGVGSARFLAGLVRVVDPASLTVVVNTGDDETVRGLHVSPDVDTVLYHLAGLADWPRGWGVAGETFVAHERYAELASIARADTDLQEWFALGDRDLAVHQLRTQILAAGGSLSAATDAVRRALGVACRVLPMSDDPAPTLLRTTGGEVLDFQTYFVRRGQRDEIASVEVAGGSPAPGVLEALAGADVVVIPPSNPLLSVAPVLAVDGVRDALAAASAVRVGVSPIVGGRALKGPADRLLASLGYEVSAAGVAGTYCRLVDVFVLDETDAPLAADVEALGMRPVVCDTIMRSAEDAARLAKIVLAAADGT